MLLEDAKRVADRLDAGPGLDAPSAAAPARPRRGDRAEVAVLARLLGGQRFGSAVYIGSEYARVSPVLSGCADRVMVAEPGPLDVADGSADLAVMISVLRQRPDPADDFAEIARVLRAGALAVIAAPSVLHGTGRGRYQRGPQAITGSPAATGAGLAHHPETLMLQLAVCGLRVERLLPGSRLRQLVLDRVLPGPVRRASRLAAPAGPDRECPAPTLFFLARKHDLAG